MKININKTVSIQVPDSKFRGDIENVFENIKEIFEQLRSAGCDEIIGFDVVTAQDRKEYNHAKIVATFQ